MNMNLSKLGEIVEDRGAWHTAVHGVTKESQWLKTTTYRHKCVYLHVYMYPSTAWRHSTYVHGCAYTLCSSPMYKYIHTHILERDPSCALNMVCTWKMIVTIVPDMLKKIYGGKDWRWEEKGVTEDEMIGWHHRLNRHEFEQAPGVGDGQGSLACCSSWGRRVGHN